MLRQTLQGFDADQHLHGRGLLGLDGRGAALQGVAGRGLGVRLFQAREQGPPGCPHAADLGLDECVILFEFAQQCAGLSQPVGIGVGVVTGQQREAPFPQRAAGVDRGGDLAQIIAPLAGGDQFALLRAQLRQRGLALRVVGLRQPVLSLVELDLDAVALRLESGDLGGDGLGARRQVGQAFIEGTAREYDAVLE